MTGYSLKNPSEIYATWQRGIPLSQAFYRFMPRDVQEQWKSLSEANSNLTIARKLNDIVSQSVQTEPGQVMKQFAGLVDHDASRARSTLEDQLKAQCLNWIRTDALKAYGFPTPRKVSDEPSEVPADLWGGSVIWHKNTIEANGLRIEAVRIVQASPPQEDHTKKPGRPSRRDEIFQAYAELKERNAIDFETASLKSICTQIQGHLLARSPSHPDGTKGIGDKAIERTIRDDVNGEKAARSKL